MKKKYSDPLMFSNIFLTGYEVIEGPSPNGESFAPNDGLIINNVGAPEQGADVQIIEPEQKSEPTVTEESIQSVIEQLLGEETETQPSDESSLAD